MLAFATSAFLGVLFLFTGVVKLVRPRAFVSQVRQYGIVPPMLARRGSLALIAAELGLGTALCLGSGRAALAVATGLLLLFALLTAWGFWQGRIEDCGCYGGLLSVSPAQSLVLDTLYLAVAGVGLWAPPPPAWAQPAPWKWALSALVLVASGVLAARFERSPPARFDPLREGSPWRRRWLGKRGPDLAGVGEHLLVFMSPECPFCKQWVPLLNALHVQSDSPRVTGLLAAAEEDREAFLAAHMIRFPILAVGRVFPTLLVEAYPTAALVANGVVRERWIGKMPEPYFGRVQAFFDALAPATGRDQRRSAFNG